MKTVFRYAGLALMLLGTACLVALHIVQLTFVNRLTVIPLALIVTGLVLHVWAMKRESKY